jgi:N-acetylglucosamine-6-phosphate deacetylase
MGDLLRLRADRLVTPGGILRNAHLEIRGSRVHSIASDDHQHQEPAEHVPGWIVPGFVDSHVHGGGGCNYATDDQVEALEARAFHATRGTTTSLASLITAPLDVLLRQIAALGELVDDGHFAGLHLEGPFLSPAQPGAHEVALLRAPDPATIDRLLKAGGGRIATVTLAPELAGGLDAVRRFTAAGVRVAVGHTAADRATTAAALEAGATLATHLFNAMPGIHHREPGPIPLLLDDSRVGVELIADGFHVHRDVLQLAAAAAGRDRVVLVTDAMAAAGMPDGQFRLGGRVVDVRDGRARLARDDGEPGPIAGSTATMATAFTTLAAITGRIDHVAAMASTNAARNLGLADVGRISPGARADLCVVDDSGALQRVMHAGRWLPGS